MIIIWRQDEKDLIRQLRAITTEGQRGIETVGTLTAEVVALKQEIASLEIAKSKREEDFARQERELRHMVGLEKQRQAQEQAQAKVDATQAAREAKLDVRELNIEAEKKRFAEQLEFNTQRFLSMEAYLKDMTKEILGRLPDVRMRVEDRRIERKGE